MATEGVLRDSEKASIDRSLEALRVKLESCFTGASESNESVKRHFAFGSYTRGTILPRPMDPQSDVDYMIVFADSDSKPQTCLERLKRFVERHYRSSEITQSHPTIILSMNHIRFELVPAIETFWRGIQIPAKRSLFSEWMMTSPNAFNEELSQKNKSNNNLIKPLARLVKYWNVCNKYPFESFQLEKRIVDHWTLSIDLFGGNLRERFDAFMDDLSVFWSDTAHQKSAIGRAHQILAVLASAPKSDPGPTTALHSAPRPPADPLR